MQQISKTETRNQSTKSLMTRIQRLKNFGIVIGSRQSPSEKQKITNSFKVVEEIIRKQSIAQLKGTKQKELPKPPRKVLAHKKIQTSTFDTMKELIHKNRSNLQYLKTYSRNLKQSIKADVIHTDAIKQNTIKKSTFMEQPNQNFINEFVNSQLGQFTKQQRTSHLGSHKKSCSVILNNYGRMMNSSSIYSIGSQSKKETARNWIDKKAEKVKLAVEQINKKQTKIYNKLKSSARQSSASAISIRSNIDRINILYGNRWNKMFNRVINKYSLQKDHQMLSQQLDLLPTRVSTTDNIRKVQRNGFSISENKEYLKNTPILKF